MSIIQTKSASTPDPEHILVDPPRYVLWDFAGGDGLQVAIALFTPTITHLAPFQSLTAEFNQQPCAVLRLCENNFRVALSSEASDLTQAIAALGLKVWTKRCDSTTTISLPAVQGLRLLPHIATTKPIYTLNPFPLYRAVPARIKGTAILAWHHAWNGEPRLDIQTADADLPFVTSCLRASMV